jgi:serine/threonine-protein kinase
VSEKRTAAPEPTEIAGRYEIVQKLGAGAFGTVYKAKDRRLGRMVAIKTIRLEGLAASQAGLEEMLERFEREARTAAKLKHPGIVTIHDFGESEGLTYLAMEFIDGIGLERIISETGRLSVERAAALGAQVAEALHYAHEHGVVHRDIKPANIMVEAGDRVKVTDFGIAKPGDSAEHLTVTGSLLGTPSYMSPEQARGQKLDGRSDLFSLGCVLYEMVAGKKAFRGDSITALLFKIISEEPPSLREIDPSVSEGILQVIGRALAKAPETRFQSGQEMAEALLALTRPGFVPTLRAAETPTLPTAGGIATILTAPPLEAPPTVASAPTVAKPAVPPTVLSPASATAAAPPPLPPAAKPAPRAAASTAPAGAARKKGSGVGLIVGLGVGAVLLLGVLGVGGYLLLGQKPDAPTPATTPTPVADYATPTPPPVTHGAEATPAPAEVAPSLAATAAPAVPTPRPPAAPPGTTAVVRTPPSPARTDATGVPAPEPGPPMAASLDELPSGGPDGRELGEDVAAKYRAGGSSGIANRRFSQRPRIPRHAPAERPGVSVLAWINVAQQSFFKANNRYGTPAELRQAGLFRPDVAVADNGSFERKGYRFQVTASGASYRASAQPLGPDTRAFYVDENGFVLSDE